MAEECAVEKGCENQLFRFCDILRMGQAWPFQCLGVRVAGGPGGELHTQPQKPSARKSRRGSRTALCSNVQLGNVRPSTSGDEADGGPRARRASRLCFSALSLSQSGGWVGGKTEEERESPRTRDARVFG
uniref:Uncharacterized protein n=1 Tax=Sphaerodactylus townsendi TaxID=933632 RepID=A0ACB8ECY4_9SAUR